MTSFRALPSVDRVVAALKERNLDHNGPDPNGPDPIGRQNTLMTAAARRAIDRARDQVRAGEAPPPFEAVVADARALFESDRQDSLRRVVNATGVIVHTNLGRVPLGRGQLDAIEAAATSYSNLEYDVAAGTRGSRYTHAAAALAKLTGAESAVVVNNNAAAVLLVLAALAGGKDVIASRGELVEIGGEFRIPDVMGISGARLVEVGTTNRTHIADYERAITDRTAVILKVHQSNYRMVGFTADVSPRELAKLAHGRKLWFVHDVGSGLVMPDRPAPWLGDEPTVEDSIAEGADVVTFSGDKLFGGPQAGIVVGRSRAIQKVSTHPLLRALRPDKMTLAAVAATALAYLEGEAGELPLWSMALAPLDGLERRASRMAERIVERGKGAGISAEAISSVAVSGGGSLPGTEIESWAVTIAHPAKSAAEIDRALRSARSPVIARVEDDRVILDVRTIRPDEDELVAELVAGALGAPA
jgi:L-seryl-tRNA(Ser) seleniumtransferase